MNKSDYFNEFKDGTRELFFIVTMDYIDILRQNNMIFSKKDDGRLSIIGFTTEEEAYNFFKTVITEKNRWKIVRVNVMTFDDFLESLDGDFRENLVFEMI